MKLKLVWVGDVAGLFLSTECLNEGGAYYDILKFYVSWIVKFCSEILSSAFLGRSFRTETEIVRYISNML